MQMCASWNKRLRKIVEQSGLQQKDLAYRSGLAQSSLSRLMTDEEADVRLSTLRPLAKALGIRLAALVDDEEPLPESPLTPYDTNPEYRDLIANLEAIDQSDREAILRIVEKLAEAVGQPHTPRRESGPANPGPLTLPSSQPYNDHAGYLMPSRQRKRATREPTGEPKSKV